MDPNDPLPLRALIGLAVLRCACAAHTGQLAVNDVMKTSSTLEKFFNDITSLLRVQSYRPFSSQLFFIFFLHNSSQRDLSNEISLITHLTMQGLYKAMLLRLQTLFLMFWEKSSKNSKYHHFLYFSYFYFIWFCCGNNAFCMISFFYLRF